MIYGPLDAGHGSTDKYRDKQVRLADSLKELKNKQYTIQRLSINVDSVDYPYNGYRYMEPFEEKTHLDHLLDNLEYLQQVYSDCVCTLIRDNGSEEDKKQMEEVLAELKYLLATHNKVDFVTKLFPEYFNITEIDTGTRITTENIEELKTGIHSYKMTILVR